MATLSYQGTLNYARPDTLTITSTDTNSGTDVDTLAITMVAVNDALVVAANTGSTVVCSGIDVITNAELQITDVDNTSGQLTYTVTAALLNGRLELTMLTSVTITIFTQANIDAGRVVFTHGGAAVTSESFTFTVRDGGGIGGSGGTGSGSGSGSGTGGGIALPSIQLPFLPISTEALITNVSEVRGTEDLAPRVVMANQTFVRVEQLNTVAQEQATASAEPLSPLGKNIRAVGQKLVERLTKLANDLERGVQEQEHKAQLIGQVASYSGMALFASFVAWIRRAGALVTSLLVSMPAWRHLDQLPVLGGRTTHPPVAKPQDE